MKYVGIMAKRRSSTQELEPGENTISEVRGRRQDDGAYWLDWSYRPLDGSRTKQYRSKGRTIGEARRRAYDKVERMSTAAAATTWTTKDALTDYLELVSRPAIDAARLTDGSRKRYTGVLRYLQGTCPDHEHTSSLADHTIASGARFRPLERCLHEIARLHGPETAHQARSVLGKYVLDQLIRDDLITASPIAGKRIDLSGGHSARRTRGGVALTQEQWNAVVDHLLTLDPADGVKPPKRGMYTLADRIAVRANAIDLTLLQAMTGLRVGEATAITWSMVSFDDKDKTMTLALPPALVKTRRGRMLFITDPAVVDRFRQRRQGSKASHPVIPSPARPAGLWDESQRNKAVKSLYVDLAEALDIDVLRTERSHVWRATINTLTMSAGVPEAIRTAHLGHTAQVSRTHYTDTSNGSVLADSLTQLRSTSQG